jgi:tetratricopeptide (TPR) repeat protein
MEFTEGDIFYTTLNGQYHFHKVLRVDDAFNTYHVLTYDPVSMLPAGLDTQALTIFAYHSPIDKNGFENPVRVTQSEVTDDELTGFHTYIRVTDNMDLAIPEATRYFHEGYALTDEKKHEEAIRKYSIAVELFPLLYEALDNRAFCKMDLGRWQDAIDDFRLSLQIHPFSALAEFSIGECYLKMGDLEIAKIQFQKSLEIDPGYDLPQEFLNRVAVLEQDAANKK